MPEGDTVFLTARRLAAALAGKVLVRGEIRHPRLSTVDFAGRVVRGAGSVGKHLFIRFDRELSLHNHLGMDGSWRLAGPAARLGHQVRVVLVTADKAAIGVNLHKLALVPTTEEHRLVEHLGPDLLAADWSDAHAAEAARRLSGQPDREIGVALLDQRAMAGVGNVYKAEVCFLLGVSPWTPVSEVDSERAVRLSRELLLRNTATFDRSTTGDTRRDRRLWVYGRARSGCLRCGGPVRVADQGDDARERITYFCPACQPGPHP
ncbi:MAG TPA: DNA-formamidopyrimidine glycosylase family protein [Actinophytocola sp.]|uniref:DNA-formamidopyrimidine glycosylase family protein n=1 Tax=Actinophytocola sp. TaxID=1872138 RepID=UPI002DBD6E79|nr:DNA-formamidopyrimidine glycosylase family protein [Actinophytocola sp.]HEU5470581.1 DNA-formamidopyrimidine glycosylase family protein [Actinophytocola sp.]